MHILDLICAKFTFKKGEKIPKTYIFIPSWFCETVKLNSLISSMSQKVSYLSSLPRQNITSTVLQVEEFVYRMLSLSYDKQEVSAYFLIHCRKTNLSLQLLRIKNMTSNIPFITKVSIILNVCSQIFINAVFLPLFPKKRKCHSYLANGKERSGPLAASVFISFF